MFGSVVVGNGIQGIPGSDTTNNWMLKGSCGLTGTILFAHECVCVCLYEIVRLLFNVAEGQGSWWEDNSHAMRIGLGHQWMSSQVWVIASRYENREEMYLYIIQTHVSTLRLSVCRNINGRYVRYWNVQQKINLGILKCNYLIISVDKFYKILHCNIVLISNLDY